MSRAHMLEIVDEVAQLPHVVEHLPEEVSGSDGRCTSGHNPPNMPMYPASQFLLPAIGCLNGNGPLAGICGWEPRRPQPCGRC